jgi:hypothetical protein
MLKSRPQARDFYIPGIFLEEKRCPVVQEQPTAAAALY